MSIDLQHYQEVIDHIPKHIATDGSYASFETNDLFARSAKMEDLDFYLRLFTGPEMKYYGTGIPWSQETIEKTLRLWANRWFNGDPYSAYVIFLKDEDLDYPHIPIGHFVIGHGLRKGVAEMAMIFLEEYHDKGYASQFLNFFFTQVLPDLSRFESNQAVQFHEDGNQKNIFLSGKLKEIHATCWLENPKAAHLFEKVGMQKGENFTTKEGIHKINYHFKVNT